MRRSYIYKDLCGFDFKFDFLEFVKSRDLEINGGWKQRLKECFSQIGFVIVFFCKNNSSFHFINSITLKLRLSVVSCYFFVQFYL